MGSLLVTGQRVGPYEIIARIGQGGMATVYKAYHPQLDRFVAIKMMQPTFVIESNFRTRFEREARIVGGLEHPHILPVYDFAEYEGQPYLVMKLIEGSSLKTVLSQGPLEPDDLMMVLPPIASALDYAHHQGVLHRDIKPSNILIDQRATPYLTDFGLARASHQINDNNMISQDMFIGTPYYVSPEQGMGERDLTAQSDLYSLGVVLYELLTGRVPFDSGSTFAVIHDHIYRPLPMPSSINPALTPAIELVLMKALAKHPSERYDSATEMVNALRDAFQESGIRSLKSSQAAKAAKIPTATSVAIRQMKSNTAVLPRNSRLRRRWRWAGGTAVLMAAALFGLLVISGTLTSSTPTLETGLTLYDVQTLQVDQGRAALAQNPDDPLAYLALGRAYLEQGSEDAAQTTLTIGLEHTDAPVRYLMTAATLARRHNRPNSAFTLYSQAIISAEGTEYEAEVREEAGEYLYNAASNRGMLDSLRIRRLNSTPAYQASPVVSALLARALLTDGRLQIAEIALTRALTANENLPEAHLIGGELEHARGLSDRAKLEWELVLNAEDAPRWVRERAQNLMQRS
jgi:serine/threonine protein kinase/Tfp pilus assembly protein PilF